MAHLQLRALVICHVLVDSGSSSNHISASACTAWGLVPILDKDNEEGVTLANDAKVQTKGRI